MRNWIQTSKAVFNLSVVLHFPSQILSPLDLIRPVYHVVFGLITVFVCQVAASPLELQPSLGLRVLVQHENIMFLGWGSKNFIKNTAVLFPFLLFIVMFQRCIIKLTAVANFLTFMESLKKAVDNTNCTLWH